MVDLTHARETDVKFWQDLFLTLLPKVPPSLPDEKAVEAVAKLTDLAYDQYKLRMGR